MSAVVADASIRNVGFYSGPDTPVAHFSETIADIGVPEDETAKDAGRVLIRLRVDGEFDIVYIECSSRGQVERLSDALAALTRVRDGLVALYGGMA